MAKLWRTLMIRQKCATIAGLILDAQTAATAPIWAQGYGMEKIRFAPWIAARAVLLIFNHAPQSFGITQG
jgi:hypothetical protein